jgi:hypothetical protein
MEKRDPTQDDLLKKLKTIGDLSVKNCSHPDDRISQNARDINRLAHDCYKVIRQKKDES